MVGPRTIWCYKAANKRTVLCVLYVYVFVKRERRPPKGKIEKKKKEEEESVVTSWPIRETSDSTRSLARFVYRRPWPLGTNHLAAMPGRAQTLA